MSAGAISGAANPAATSSGAFGNLSSDEFFKIMLSELSNQDPLEPQDSGALLEQLSSLRNIESQLSLQESLELLITQNSVVQASGLVGQTVEYESEILGEIRAARVTSVQIKENKITLKLDNGVTLPIGDVTGVSGDKGGAGDGGEGAEGLGGLGGVGAAILESINKASTTRGPLAPELLGI